MKGSGFSFKNILYHTKLAWALWFGLSIFAAFHTVFVNNTNNYLIYRHVYTHLLKGINLYLPYPQEYDDINLYGPVFALLMAPFNLLSDNAGAVVWVLFNVSFLLFAFYKLPISRKWKAALVLLCSHELMNASSWMQVNALICGCIILGYCYVHEQKEGKALFFIMAATFVKVYGVVGFAFFFFSKRRVGFIGWALVWTAFFFLAPLAITNFSFLLQCYKNWAACLQQKAQKNVNLVSNSYYQDISVMGMIRRIFYVPQLKDTMVLLPAAILFISQYFHVAHFKDLRFQLYLLCSVLISTVIFSSGSESPTYIIAMPGICLWYLLQPKTRLVNIFFVAAFILTTFSYSDLITPWFRTNVVRPYSIKALPSFVIWVIILVQIYKKQFLKALHPQPDAVSITQ